MARTARIMAAGLLAAALGASSSMRRILPPAMLLLSIGPAVALEAVFEAMLQPPAEMRRPLRSAGLATTVVLLATLSPRAGAGDPSRTEVVVGDRTLSVLVPAGLDAAPVPHGLMLSLPGARRSPYDVTVTIEPTAMSPAALPRHRRDGGAVVRYRLDSEEGGSGGVEVTLTAERPCDGAVLRLVLRTQVEIPSEAMLELAWAVLRGATCRRRHGSR